MIVQRKVIRGTAGLLLLLPLVAMQFTDEVAWDVVDFGIFAALLAGVCVVYEVLAGGRKSAAYRSAAGVAVGAAFALIWVTGAVGIIGAADNNANFMFGGVLVVGVAGAIMARFKPLGLSRAMFGTALAQVLVGAVALIAGFGSMDSSWPMEIWMSTVVFTALWLVSASLFRKAAREECPADGSR